MDFIGAEMHIYLHSYHHRMFLANTTNIVAFAPNNQFDLSNDVQFTPLPEFSLGSVLAQSRSRNPNTTNQATTSKYLPQVTSSSAHRIQEPPSKISIVQPKQDDTSWVTNDQKSQNSISSSFSSLTSKPGLSSSSLFEY
mmetsp:Transcript_14139/g.20192  ORF Transcript_14139/g.20192 Transcript_14139/m.20192 type:complete len:139 (-) Transcript_14139:194-610(-)